MGQINRLPNGLLSFVDTKTQGVNPASLAEVVQPHLDLEPFYRSLAGYSITTVTAVGAAAGSTSAGQLVPNDEVWLIHGVSGELTNTSAAVITVLRPTVILSSPSALQYQVLAYPGLLGVGASLAIGDTLSWGSNFDRPVVAPGGWGISLLLNAGMTGTIDTRTTVLYNACQV